MSTAEIEDIVRRAIGDYIAHPEAHADVAREAELIDERRRREEMERQFHDLMRENARDRAGYRRYLAGDSANVGLSPKAGLQQACCRDCGVPLDGVSKHDSGCPYPARFARASANRGIEGHPALDEAARRLES